MDPQAHALDLQCARRFPPGFVTLSSQLQDFRLQHFLSVSSTPARSAAGSTPAYPRRPRVERPRPDIFRICRHICKRRPCNVVEISAFTPPSASARPAHGLQRSFLWTQRQLTISPDCAPVTRKHELLAAHLEVSIQTAPLSVRPSCASRARPSGVATRLYRPRRSPRTPPPMSHNWPLRPLRCARWCAPVPVRSTAGVCRSGPRSAAAFVFVHADADWPPISRREVSVTTVTFCPPLTRSQAVTARSTDQLAFPSTIGSTIRS